MAEPFGAISTSVPTVQWTEMAISLELHNTGDAEVGAEIRALVEHALSDRPGDWRVSIAGSRENDSWEMKVWGPNGFERSYTLVGSAGEHRPLVIGSVLLKLLPTKARQV
jgi:hypothetical protein